MLKNRDILATLLSYCNYNLRQRISYSNRDEYYTRFDKNKILINGRYTIYYDENESGNNANMVYLIMIYNSNRLNLYKKISSEFGMEMIQYSYTRYDTGIYISGIYTEYGIEHIFMHMNNITITMDSKECKVYYNNAQIAEYTYENISDILSLSYDILYEYFTNREYNLMSIAE